MRVTTNMQNMTMYNSITNNQMIIANLQNQLASGQKVNSASDNPSAIPSIMDANKMLKKINTYQDNIVFLNGEIEVTDGILDQVTDKIQRLRDLTINAANATNTPAQLKLINDEVQQIKEQLVAVANTQYENSYIFAGNRTKTTPFKLADDGSISYFGTPSWEDYKREYLIADGVKVATNLSGLDVFGISTFDPGPPEKYTGNGLFQTINILSQQLESDTPNYNTIRAQIDKFDSSIANVTAARTQLGGVQSRLNMTKEQHDISSITYESLKANSQEIDIADVVSKLSTQQVSLQASLYANSQLMGMSLMDYL